MIDFLILGAQKAATSALQSALRAQPDIIMPAGESPFFEDPEYASRLWETYAMEAPSSCLRGIKRPDYLCSDQAIERISQSLPHARFIAVLREPISRAVSSYSYMIRHAHLPALPLDIGMARCIDDFEAGRETRAASVIGYGLYGRYISRWYQIYPRDHFLFLPQIAVSGDPARALARCREHLGLAPVPTLNAMPSEIGRSNEGLYDPGLLPFARIASLIQSRPIAGTLRREPRILPLRALGALAGRAVGRLAGWRGQERPKLCDDIHRRLTDIYAGDLKILLECVHSEVIYWQGKA